MIFKCMSSYLLKSIMDKTSLDKTRTIANYAGFLAGEEMAYNYLDFEDSRDIYFAKAIKIMKLNLNPDWTISNAEISQSYIAIQLLKKTEYFLVDRKTKIIQSELIRGYLTGVFQSYLGSNISFEYSDKKEKRVNELFDFNLYAFILQD